MIYRLTRIAEVKRCTLGFLADESLTHRFSSLEPPWRENKRDISCIPAGAYPCTRYKSKQFGETFLVKGVTGRDGILFHSGNVVSDTKGCICLGMNFEPWDGRWAITKSKDAMRQFMESLKGKDDFMLEIVNGFLPGE